MGFAIHDKTKEGRRKLKEGPKAQQRYLEELQAEWIDNHATKDLPTRPPNWREATVPENIRAKYLHAEAATRDQYLGQVNAKIEVLQKQTRAEVVARVARQEMQMYGYVLDKTWDEMLDLGIDPTEFDIVKAPEDERTCDDCGEPMVTEVDQTEGNRWWVHKTSEAKAACKALLDAQQAEDLAAVDQIVDELNGEDED